MEHFSKGNDLVSILLVEDDTLLNQQLTALLQAQGYIVTNESCGDRALKVIKNNTFDLVILDIELPKIDGLSLLHYIRNHNHTAVILLTAYAAEEHRIRGLKLGADDYISKPCNFTELSLRVEALLRRTLKQPATPLRNSMTYLELTLNRSEQTVSVATPSMNHLLTLTAVQFKLLWTLVNNHGALQSKVYLYQVVLEREFSPYDRSVDMHLSRLRKRLIEVGMPALRIQTVHGKGYLLK
ncbi:MAG: two-component system response regulator PfeR [Psychromonas sp.]